MNTQFQTFIPLSKVDDDQRMVYGYASTPDLDSDGEVIKVEALERALPEYMKFPTIREMHQPKAVGTTKSAEIRENGLYIGAKVVSDEAWKLVKEGVYRGFSIGGSVVQRIKNTITDLSLSEISLVDVPANKAAMIEVWKRDSSKDKMVDALTALLVKGGDIKMADEKDLNPTDETVTENEVTDGAETTVTDTNEAVQTADEAVETVDETTKEAGDFENSLEKIEKSLDAKKEPEIEKAQEQTLEKFIAKALPVLEKMSNKIADLEQRLVKVESTPAATNAQSVLVTKQLASTQEDTAPVNPELAKRIDRLNELRKEYDLIGASEYAKRGYTLEATKLQDEISKLSR